MPTTEELLEQLEAEAQSETPVCIIDPETRTITVPPEYQLLGVENDKRVERLYFQCPKIVGDNQDLSQDYILFINYANANGDPDAYKIKDMQVDGDNITFSWLLEENVTKYKGSIQIAFAAIIPGDAPEDPDKNRWNTTINTDCTCLVGLKCTQQVAESNPDALAQIWAAIDELKAGGGGGSGTPGKDGREIEIQNNGTAIQWRYVGDSDWTDLVQLSDLKGEGIPEGGTTGQVLTKNSDSNGDASWKNPSGVSDEQVKTAVNAYLQENPPSGVEIDDTLTQEGKAADAKITGAAIENNREKIDSLSDELVRKTTFVDEEKSEIKFYDCLTDSVIVDYLAYTIGTYFDELVGSTISSLSVSAKTGTKVKFSVYSYVKKYPDNPANGTIIFSKLEDVGEAISENNIATINGLDFKLLEGQVIVFSGDKKTLGYQKKAGNEYDIFGYNVNSYSLNVGGTFESAFNGSIEGNRGAYKVEYTTPEGIVRKNISDVVKEMVDPVRDIPGIKQQIENTSDDVAEIKESIENIGGAGGLKEIFENRKPINKYFVLTVDDLTRDALTITKTLIDNNIYPAFGIRMDTVGSSITWDEIRELQSMGFEMAFHGMTHSDFPADSSPTKDDIMESQIKEFKELCKENDVYIKGYLGPNHYKLPVSCRREFEWARSAYGSDAYGGGGKFSDTFANVIVMSMEITSDSQDLSEFKSWSESVGDNQYLTPMCHTQNLVAQIDRYLELFKKWNNDGLICIRPCDAVRQSLWDCGSIGQNSTFEIQAGIATKPYCVIAKNGNIKTSQSLV